MKIYDFFDFQIKEEISNLEVSQVYKASLNYSNPPWFENQRSYGFSFNKQAVSKLHSKTKWWFLNKLILA